MKSCKHCSASNKDENQFCINCGLKLDEHQYVMPPVPPVQQPYSSAPAPFSYGQPNNYYFSPAQPDPNRIQRIRDLASSNLMLILVILWFAQILMSVAVSAVSSDLSYIIPTTSDSKLIRIFSDTMPIFSLVSSITGMIPSILIGIGLLMINRSASDRHSSMSTSGISLIRVISIIQFSFICIALFALFMVSLLVLSGSLSGLLDKIIAELQIYDYFEGINFAGIINVIGVALIIGIIIGGAVVISYFVILIKFLGSVLATVRTGIPQEKFASALSVISFIIGGLSAIGVFGALVSISTASYVGLLDFITSALSATVYILMGVIIHKYKQAVYG